MTNTKTNAKTNGKTKKVFGTDLNAKDFLWTDDQPHPKFWVLPICDRTSREKTIRLIKLNLERWDNIKRHIPLCEQERVRWQLEGAAVSYGVDFVPDTVTVTDDEVTQMLAERFASRMLELSELDKLYD